VDGFSGRDFSDFFETIFGNPSGRGGFAGARASSRGAGESQTVPLDISLEEAYSGGQRALQVQAPEQEASGRIINRARTLNVKIPAGVTHGQKIRLAGQGQPGSGGGPSGDLYLEMRIKPHPLYAAHDRDITLDLPLTPWEAALGGKVDAPTLGGSVTLNIPANARNGQKLRLRGRGLPGQPPGDQIVVLRIVNPPAETEAARDLFRRMAQELPFDPRAHWDG
jgi:curved DNA-binding protein